MGGRKGGNTIRSAPKRKTRKARKELTQKNDKSYKAKMDDSTEKTKNARLPKKKRVALERIDKAVEKIADQKDGANKERIYTEGASSKTKPLPKSNKDLVTEKEIKEEGLIERIVSTNPCQDSVITKAGEKSGIRPLPTGPNAREEFVKGIKRAPSESDRAKAFNISQTPIR